MSLFRVQTKIHELRCSGLGEAMLMSKHLVPRPLPVGNLHMRRVARYERTKKSPIERMFCDVFKRAPTARECRILLAKPTKTRKPRECQRLRPLSEMLYCGVFKRGCVMFVCECAEC